MKGILRTGALEPEGDRPRLQLVSVACEHRPDALCRSEGAGCLQSGLLTGQGKGAPCPRKPGQGDRCRLPHSIPAGLVGSLSTLSAPGKAEGETDGTGTDWVPGIRGALWPTILWCQP